MLHAGLVGQRVVVRRRVPGERGPTGGPAMTDVLGTLEWWGQNEIRVRADDGEPVSIPLALIVSGRAVPPRPPRPPRRGGDAGPGDAVGTAAERMSPPIRAVDGRGGPMDKTSLEDLASRHLQLAREASAGRSAETVYGGHEHMLRQTMVALTDGTELAEHENPGEATLQVLSGRVRLGAGEEGCEATTGDLVEIPPSRHNLVALEDSVVLLTVAKRL